MNTASLADIRRSGTVKDVFSVYRDVFHLVANKWDLVRAYTSVKDPHLVEYLDRVKGAVEDLLQKVAFLESSRLTP